MKRRLRPLRTQRRVRFRLTLPTLLLPVLALVLLGRSDVLRRPFGEREAAFAMAAQPQRLPSLGAPERLPAGGPSGATLAAVGAAARLLSSSELHLRLPGLLAGIAALGAAIVLGERLFATRIGLLAALLLLGLPASSSWLGTDLSCEPFYLLAMLVALAAIRDTGDSKASAVWAGIGGGAAIAVGGADGAWLPAMALVWLWSNHGLTRRSLATVVSSTALTALAVTAASHAWLVRAAGRAPAIGWHTLAPQLAGVAMPGELPLLELLPLLPFGLLGVGSLPAGWAKDPSLRFLLLWLASASVSLLCTASPLPAFVALVFLLAMLAVWGIANAQPRKTIAAGVAAIALAALAWQLGRAPGADEEADRWAVREAGRFVWRTVPAERRVAAATRIRQRIAYYSRRAVEPLAAVDRPVDLAGMDYVVLDRDELRILRGSLRAAGRGGGAPDGSSRNATPRERSVRDGTAHGPSAADGLPREAPPPQLVAEFGPWAIGRLGPAARRPSEKLPAGRTHSPFVRPPEGEFPQ